MNTRMATESEHYRLWSTVKLNQMVNNHPDLLKRRSERLELRSRETSTVLVQLGFPQMCQLMSQLWPLGSSQQSPARHNCTWYFRLQSRKFSCTQRHSGKWAVTKTASLGEMEIVGGWCPYTCKELFSPWIRRKKNGFPENSSSSRSTRYANYTKDNLLHWQTVRCK